MLCMSSVAAKFVFCIACPCYGSANQVLLDNLNSAPPQVMERLNSLFEDDPSLNIYEHSQGAALSRGDGSIHRGFRLFATSNPGRTSGHKLTKALINRVIKICLLPLDSGLNSGTADEHDLLHIIVQRFEGVHGGYELAHLCVRIHAAITSEVAAGQIRLMGGYPLTARSLLQAIQGSLHYMQTSNTSPVAAVTKALLTTYLPGIANPEQQSAVLQMIVDMLRSPDLSSNSTYEQPPVLTAEVDAWQQQAGVVSSKLAQLEQLVAVAAWQLVPAVANVELSSSYAKQVSKSDTACLSFNASPHKEGIAAGVLQLVAAQCMVYVAGPRTHVPQWFTIISK